MSYQTIVAAFDTPAHAQAAVEGWHNTRPTCTANRLIEVV